MVFRYMQNVRARYGAALLLTAVLLIVATAPPASAGAFGSKKVNRDNEWHNASFELDDATYSYCPVYRGKMRMTIRYRANNSNLDIRKITVKNLSGAKMTAGTMNGGSFKFRKNVLYRDESSTIRDWWTEKTWYDYNIAWGRDNAVGYSFQIGQKGASSLCRYHVAWALTK